MWDTAFAIIRDNPLFGVGLDSLGDYSLAYQSEKTANGIAEYIDNVHNFLLQFAATGGVSLALIYAILILAVGYLFLNKIFTMDRFEVKIVALFCAWISFQLQSLISPAAIPTLIWNFIICGAIIGLLREDKISDLPKNNKSNNLRTNSKINEFINFKCFISVTIAVTLTFPLFSADKLAREANLKGDANLALRAATKYPESVIRYNRLGADLYNAGLYDLSLEIGRDAVKFNPNSYLTWILILLNPNAPIPERQIAKNELIRIAPHNKDIQNYSFESISED
jgi:hypothetical protein